MDTAIAQNLRVTQVHVQEPNTTRTEYLLQTDVCHIFLVIDMFLLLPLCYFHYLIVCMIRRESRVRKGQNLLKELLACYSVMVPITFLGNSAYFDIMTRFLHTPTIFRGFWFCFIFEIFTHVSTVYTGGFSVYVASLKYWRIVHNSHATRIGEEQARKICFILHLVLPILVSILNSISNGKIDQLFSVDHCWSIKEAYEMTGTTPSDKIQNLFCVNRHYELEKYFSPSVGKNIARILRGLCGSVKIFYLLLLSNLVELVIYILIFKYLNR